MGDLISKNKAIKALGSQPINWTGSEYERGKIEQWKNDVEIIKSIKNENSNIKNVEDE